MSVMIAFAILVYLLDAEAEHNNQSIVGLCVLHQERLTYFRVDWKNKKGQEVYRVLYDIVNFIKLPPTIKSKFSYQKPTSEGSFS